jgi:cellulose biosynthesis protein BcsQ
MLFACWSVKGGSGTTVVAVALALVLAESSARPVLLVDTAGDVPTALGADAPEAPGLADWLAAEDVSAEALGRLTFEASPRVDVLPWHGGLAPPPSDPDRLLDALGAIAADGRDVVLDCGSTGGSFGLSLAAAAGMSLLVLRPCFLALRRAMDAPIRPSAVVLVTEPGRTLTAEEVEDCLGVPVHAEVPWDAGVARAVDAGLLVSRLPRALARPLREAA